MKIKPQTLDLIALTSSLVCAIHCAAIPLVLSFYTLGSLQFLHNPLIEWFFIGIGFVFVVTSLWPSYKKTHHKIKPLLFSCMGFGFIMLGKLELSESWEIFNTIIGTFLVSIAHYTNWKLLQAFNNNKTLG